VRASNDAPCAWRLCMELGASGYSKPRDKPGNRLTTNLCAAAAAIGSTSTGSTTRSSQWSGTGRRRSGRLLGWSQH
jgi:hypothetical protein